MIASLSRSYRSTLRISAVLAIVAAATSLAGCANKDASESKAGGGRASEPASPKPASEPGMSPPPAATAAPSAAAESPVPGGSDAKRSANSDSDSGRARRQPKKPEERERPGLGTEWGETRTSSMTTVSFVRADSITPFATASLFYNDAQGARAMADMSGYRTVNASTFSAAQGAVRIGLKGEDGRFLNGFEGVGRDTVIGEVGRRYTIVIKNLTDARFECVVSVDGLDVIDGRTAGFAKRGYLVDPHGELEVDGFRQSNDTVAAFRFGSVRGSYASKKHGETRNVGVIGVALFHERGSNPHWTRAEVERRQAANPFPGGFATPPR
jgi:hypothetical protein